MSNSAASDERTEHEQSITSDRFKSRIWWGTKDDLKKLTELITDLQRSASEEARHQLDDARNKAEHEDDERLLRLADAIATGISKRGGDASFFADPSQLLDEARMLRLTRAETADKSRNVRDLELKVTVRHKSWNEERTGSPETVLKNLDPSETVMVRFEFGKSWDSPMPYLLVSIGGNGCEVELRGPRNWVSAASGQLKVELAKCGNKLEPLYNAYFLAGLGFVLGVALTVMLISGLTSPERVIWVVPVAGVIGGMATPPLVERLLPPFEITDSSRRLRRFFTFVIGTVGLGILVNMISRSLGV